MSGQTFSGLGVCEGIAFGRVHIVDRRQVSIPRYHIPPDQREQELARFEQAIEVSELQFGELRDRAGASGLAQVELLLRAHAAILRDAALRDATRDRILNDGQNAEWALKETVKRIKALFDRLDQDYFRERRSDVDVVGDRVLRNLVGAETEVLNHLSEDAVVVAHDLSPADTVSLAKFATRAFVTERGGRTSHTAILARALNVPCVLNVRGVMEVAGSGDEIMVDGHTGQVVLRPSKAQAGRYRSLARRRHREERALLADRELPAETLDGERVELLGNIEVSQEIESVLRHGGEGIGLYRTEFLYVEDPDLTGAEDHHRAYCRVLDALEGRSVTIRTVDVGGDKFLRQGNGSALVGPSPEVHRGRRSGPASPSNGHSDSGPVAVVNPALGLRAIRLSLRDLPRFREQLEGILLASASGRVRLLLPFVTDLEEVRQAKAVLEEVQSKLDHQGRPYDRQMQVGIMIETPAAAWIADILAREVDFFAIGTNDLIQYALATDRANEQVAYLYRPCHPAVLRIIEGVCRAAARAHKPVSLCGEMASDPFHVPVLIGLGLRSLSMSARRIPMVKRMVRRLSARECRAFAEQAASLSTAAEVEAMLSERLRDWAPDLFGRAV